MPGRNAARFRQHSVRNSALLDHVACVGNCQRSRLASRVSQNSPRTRLLASNRMMLRQSRRRLFSSLKAGNLTDSLSAPACPQRKKLGHPPAFAIGLMALWQERVARRATASLGARMPKPRRVEDATPTAAEPPVPLAPRRRTAIQRALLPLVA